MVLPPASDRLLAYMDILGWSEIVRDESRAGQAATAMLDVQGEKSAWNMAATLVRSDNPVQMSEISDGVVLSCDVNSLQGREQLLVRVCRLYMWWLEHGFLCRGAIVAGRAVHSDNVVYGAALVDAYRLERQLAVYPRIIVREEDLAQLGTLPVLRMEDGVAFLDCVHGWFPPGHASVNSSVDRVMAAAIKTEHGRWRTQLAKLKQNQHPTIEELKVIAKHEWIVAYLKKARDS